MKRSRGPVSLREHKPVLQIDRLTVQRGTTMLLSDFSWRVHKDEHWVILGANGSGKTSLLSALTGYLTPTAGEIQVFGEFYGQTDWRALRTKIGLVSSSIRQMMAESEPALDTIASGKFAMIDFWGEPTRKDRAAATKILQQVECEYLADRPWAYLSQGERQRVLIGRALMAKPALLILDEPCAGLDPVAREHFLQFLDRFKRQANAPTLVLVTHHVEEIRPIFSHVLLLKNGTVLAQGKKTDMLTSALLSKAFEAKVRLSKSRNRYSLDIGGDQRVIV